MKRTRILLAAGLLAGLMAFPATASAEPECPDKVVGPVVHTAEETVEGVTGENAVTELLHEEVEPAACELLP